MLKKTTRRVVFYPVLDKSEAGATLVNAAWGARMRESDDTPLGIGKSMDTNRDLSSLNSWGLPSPNQMTMSFWIKFVEPATNSAQPVGIYGNLYLYLMPSGELQMRNGSAAESITTDSPVKSEKWYYVIGTHDLDQNILKFWLDGKLIGESVSTDTNNSYTSRSFGSGNVNGIFIP